MRRIVLLTLVLVTVAAAPETARSQNHTRLTIGVGTWTLRGEAREETSFSSISRFTTAVSTVWELRGGFGVRTEFGYTLRGADARTELNGVPVDATINMTYVDFPLLLEWYPSPQVVIFAGPAFLYRLDARIRFRSLDGGPTFTENDPTVRRSGWAGIVGAETGFPVGEEEVLVGTRLVMGLTNARNEAPALRHAGLVIYGGFKF